MTDKKLFPGLEGIACAESQVSFIDGQKGVLEYRGYGIADLAHHGTFEEVAYLGLHGELPTRAQLDAFDKSLRERRALEPGIVQALRAMPTTAHPMKVVQAGSAMMGMYHPISDVYDAAAYDEATLRLIAQFPTLVAAWDRLRNGQEPVAPHPELGAAANFLYMLTAERPDEIVARTFDVALILHMEHTMNASTFTGRVVASTLADPYAVVSSAVGSLTGPLHGGANERALAELHKIPSVGAVDELIGAKIDRKEKIMGLGHRVYKIKDPRSTLLEELAEQMMAKTGKGEMFEIARRVEAYATERFAGKGIYPNVDFYSGIVYEAMGIRTDLFTPIFAISRVAGWLAHAREQIQGNRIFRPTQVYTGHRDRSYTPLAER